VVIFLLPIEISNAIKSNSFYFKKALPSITPTSLKIVKLNLNKALFFSNYPVKKKHKKLFIIQN